MKRVSRSSVSALVCLGLSAALASPAFAQQDAPVPSGQTAAKTPGAPPLTGTWRGTSTCTDRVAAPACNDETVVYEFSAGPKPGVVHWKADKIVNGQRVPMGEFDVEYDKTEACWKAEYHGPRVTSVWRLTVKDGHLTGTGRQLPGNQTIRKLDLVAMAPQ